MKLKDFDKVIERFKMRPISGRKLYIYFGKLDTIKNVVPFEILKELDLLKIIPGGDYPDDRSIQTSIKNALRFILQESIKSLKGQQVLFIVNSWVLARYKIPIAIFYQYYLGDKTMVVLHIHKICFDDSLPKYITFKENIVFKYFEKLLPEENKDNILEEY